MPGNPDGLKSLAKYSKLPIERIRYHPDADEEIIKTISRGILFQIAFWSGPAVQAFARITEVITRLDPAGKLEFVVVDIDGAERLSAVSEYLGGVRGVGETAWIRNGSIVATSGYGFNIDCYVPNTMMLLNTV